MATVSINPIFDGSTPVDRLPGQSSLTWGTQSTPRLDHYSVYLSGPDELDAIASLTGSNWRVNYLRIAGDQNKTTLQDLNGQSGRRIDYLELGYNSDVDLISTRVGTIQGWEGQKHDIQLGSEYTTSIELGADVNIVKTGTGDVGRINFYGAGRGNVTASSFVNVVDFSTGNDRLTVDGGNVFAASMQDGNDIVVVKNGGVITSLSAFQGSVKTTVENGSEIRSFRGGEGDVEITLLGTGRASEVSVYRADLTFVSDKAYTNFLQGYEVSSDISVGDGGIGGIKFTSDTAQTHTITGSADGYIASIDTTDNRSNATDDQSATINLSYFAGTVRTGNGKDKVTTGNGETGWVELIATSGGNDVVTLGTGGAGVVHTSRGNDVIRVNEQFYNAADQGVVIRGGDGVDQLNFSAFIAGVTFSLDATGTPQEAATGAGFISEFGIENLIGSNEADTLTGDLAKNIISGRGGADRVFGGSGNDVLKGDAGNDRLFGQLGRDNIQGGKGKDLIDGGKANDTLRGNGGADTFVFGANSGTDRVMDFADGTDILRLVGHTGGFGDLGFADVGGDREITHDNGTILLVGDAGLVLTAADFEFV